MYCLDYHFLVECLSLFPVEIKTIEIIFNKSYCSPDIFSCHSRIIIAKRILFQCISLSFYFVIYKLY